MASIWATKNGRRMVCRLGQHYRSFVSPTVPKFTQNTSNSSTPPPQHNKYAMTGEFGPVYIVLGMVAIAVSIGIHTAKQQLVHSPGVHISKKKRSSIPEADIPHIVAESGTKFIDKSFLRKVGHIQQDKRNTRPDPFFKPKSN